MRLERHGGLFLGILLGIWITGNFLHWVIDVNEPNQELVEKARRENEAAKPPAPPEPKHNDTGLYAEVLDILPSCRGNEEKSTGDKFYLCPNGSKITQINWTRMGGERKGVVTRYFNPQGELVLIYGHPDDE